MTRPASALARLAGRSRFAGVALIAAGSILLIGIVIAIAGFDPVAAVASLLSQSSISLRSFSSGF